MEVVFAMYSSYVYTASEGCFLLPYSAKFWRGKYWWIGFIQKFDRKNIDGQFLREPVFAIQLENIERENFDGSLDECQICQYPPIKILRYMI